MATLAQILRPLDPKASQPLYQQLQRALREAIETRVLVTERMTPLIIGGHTVHQIGLPYHWGVGGDAVVSGDAVNDLIGLTLDPNVQIQECKVGSCDIQPGRRPQGAELLALVEEYQVRSGATIETDNARITDPAHETVYPPPEQDDPNQEGYSRW